MSINLLIIILTKITMNKSIYSNKIHQIYNSIHNDNVDRSQIQLYRSQIKYIKEFQNKEKVKIEKKTLTANDKVKKRNNSEKNNKNYFLLNSYAIPNKDKENNSLSLMKTKNIHDKEIRLYEYDLKNYNANYIKDLENITKKIKQRYDNLNKVEKNENNYLSKNHTKHKRNIFKIPLKANINNKNSALKKDANNNKNYRYYMECNSNKSHNLKQKENINIHLTSDIIKINDEEIYEKESKLDKSNISKYTKESDKKEIVQEKFNSSKKSVKFTQEYEQINKQLNELYLYNSRNRSTLNQNQNLSKEIASNIEKITKSSIFELTKSSENFLFDRTPIFKKLNSSAEKHENLVNFEHVKNMSERIFKNSNCHKNISNVFKISEKNKKKKNREYLLNSIFPDANKGFNKINDKNFIKKSCDKQKNIESNISQDMFNFKNKMNYNNLDQKNEKKTNQDFIINTDNSEKNNNQSKIDNNNFEIYNNYQKIFKVNNNSDKNLFKIDEKVNIECQNSSRNKIKRVSILKYKSNQTYRSGSTAAPSNNEIITASIINKPLVDVDESYGGKNCLKSK